MQQLVNFDMVGLEMVRLVDFGSGSLVVVFDMGTRFFFGCGGLHLAHVYPKVNICSRKFYHPHYSKNCQKR